jgi:hypothetical protein
MWQDDISTVNHSSNERYALGAFSVACGLQKSFAK